MRLIGGWREALPTPLAPERGGVLKSVCLTFLVLFSTLDSSFFFPFPLPLVSGWLPSPTFMNKDHLLHPPGGSCLFRTFTKNHGERLVPLSCLAGIKHQGRAILLLQHSQTIRDQSGASRPLTLSGCFAPEGSSEKI